MNEPERNNSIHGLLWDKTLTVVDQNTGGGMASLTLNYVFDQTDPGYPFHLSVNLTFMLDADGYQYRLAAENMQEAYPLPFFNSWHPYFNCKVSEAIVIFDPCSRWAHMEVGGWKWLRTLKRVESALCPFSVTFLACITPPPLTGCAARCLTTPTSTQTSSPLVLSHQATTSTASMPLEALTKPLPVRGSADRHPFAPGWCCCCCCCCCCCYWCLCNDRNRGVGCVEGVAAIARQSHLETADYDDEYKALDECDHYTETIRDGKVDIQLHHDHHYR